MLRDNLYVVWRKLFRERTASLETRFSGFYRAKVVETNDPLNMFRLRFRCPDMHDSTLKAEDCPWAVPAPGMGGRRAGSWVAPTIGDYIWITFEKNHPYGPVWVGFASPTRRKFYPYPAVYTKTPLSVNDEGQVADKPLDYNEEFLPKDGRPMSFGQQDRYGNLDLSSAVGFYPSEHEEPPPPPDFDAIQNSEFQQADIPPKVNEPDTKMMVRVTKYGMISLMGDQGYWWQKKEKEGDEASKELGEFVGDAVKDEDYENKRWQYVQKLLNANKPSGQDLRMMMDLTRYGHRIEARDTGWAQIGPVKSKSRAGEYGDERRVLSKEEENDFRWLKFRTKGGWLFQAYDKGWDPEEDEWIKRPILEEVGAGSEKEDVHWKDKDARFLRIMGRHFKFVLDERGTDPKESFTKENPRGNGVLLKGRRSPGCLKDGAVEGNPRGFYFEFNENDKGNHTTWGSPMGQAIEMNDATEYLAVCVGLGKDYSTKWRNVEENEFLLEPTRKRQPDTKCYALILDHQNEFLSLKTRAGKGEKPGDEKNKSELGEDDLNQGLEAHDGSQGDGPWVEVVDSEHRGLFFHRKKKLSILRAKKDKKLYVWLDEEKNAVVVFNDEADGKVQIRAAGDIEVISTGGDITFQARNINFKADAKIRCDAGGGLMTIERKKISTTVDIYGREAMMFVHGVKAGPGAGDKQPGGDRVEALEAVEAPEQVEPTDRGKTYNEPSVMEQDEVEHHVKK